jgi:hypothetical protein
MGTKRARPSSAVLQNIIAALLLALIIAMAWVPAACFEPPQIPTGPALPTFTVPEAPTPSVPTVEPPQAPTPPQTPGMPGGGGNCCLRAGNPHTGKSCAGAASCCTPDYTSSGDCEDAKGFWFFSKDGCAGAC